MTEYRRILIDNAPVDVTRDGALLIGHGGVQVDASQATHLPPVTPTKIIACHLNYSSRVAEFMTKLPPAPTYFHKPTTALNAHGAAVARPERCRFLNYEGEIAIVIGRICRNITQGEAGEGRGPEAPS